MSNPQNSIGREYCSHFVRKETEAQEVGSLFLMPRVVSGGMFYMQVKHRLGQPGFPGLVL